MAGDALQLESVSLSRRDLAMAFSWSMINRFADVACLGFAAYAAGTIPRWAGLTVACAAARAVGTIPLMPGGLLMVEAVLVPGLVSSGMSLPVAISAMLIYRLISWLLLAAIGWVVFFFMFRAENVARPRRRPIRVATAVSRGHPPASDPTPCKARHRRTEDERLSLIAGRRSRSKRSPPSDLADGVSGGGPGNGLVRTAAPARAIAERRSQRRCARRATGQRGQPAEPHPAPTA